MQYDNVQKAERYNRHPSGVEAKHICRALDFNLGNVFKYVIRRDHKEPLRSLQSALFYLDDHFNNMAYAGSGVPFIKVLGLYAQVTEAEPAPLVRAFFISLREYAMVCRSLTKGPASYEQTRSLLLQLIAEYEGK